MLLQSRLSRLSTGICAVSAAALLLPITGCGSSDETTTDSTAKLQSGLSAKTTCATTTVETKDVPYEAVQPSDGITVKQPRHKLVAKVEPLKATAQKSIAGTDGEEEVSAKAKTGTLLFVEFHFENEGKAPIPAVSVSELFRVQLGGKVYDQPPSCRAGQAYGLKHELKPRGKMIAPGDSAVGVAAYVVPHGGDFEWLGRQTGKMVRLNTH